ncbi:MAG: HPr family phosphocarrier protein [Tissierellales bacterium]|jgi:phosphotransferase system HPr (HPr) family protein|nr:HPr family phosphocarrier protein [Tissierellales bacterium]
MLKKEVILVNDEGLQLRPAAIFVKIANKYDSDIEVETLNKRVNGKSIIGIMSLGAFKGEKITLIAKGRDEKELIEKLSAIIESGFKEV